MHLSAEECPHCGLELEQLDALYDGFTIDVRKPHDAAGVLRVPERKRVAKWIEKAERRFPQLFFNVVTCSLSDEQSLRSYGFWLLNRGVFEGMPETAREDGGVLLLIDVNRKEVCVLVGYLLDAALKEEEAFDALLNGHPYLLEANYLQAIEVMLAGVVRYVKRMRRRAKQLAKK
ncbi:TPM domain-containing protein [Rubritalea tangerina]|uniref:TPM domain-containing protein n=1 Tax=Rubritalea tangerina TaxID=430798 RepID=A0ABW4ZAT1_9BACT